MHSWKKTLLVTLMLGAQLPVLAANVPVKLYRNPNCGCCDSYADYLKTQGFDVQLIDTNDMASVKQKYAVPERLEGCHTTLIKGYVFEGLIPAQYIKRVVNEHRPIKGLSVPGMPMGAPGMPGYKQGPINVYYLDASASPHVFASF
ncbi:MAG TPA: DUF411 domain-containing protein [Noviherbaspirillum sp.]